MNRHPFGVCVRSPRACGTLIIPVIFLAAAACSKAPAAKSPLREALTKADTPTIEDAARGCFTDGGWKVDPVGSVSAGDNVITAYREKDTAPTELYIHHPEQMPRLTGGPDDDDKFWKCLAKALGADVGDKDEKAKDDKGDKGGGDKGDKGNGGDKGTDQAPKNQDNGGGGT
ncbi:MAG TPA: hypothetical protein VMI75_10655 [Polyangiaceae bacterium]|nr:hypothetical protein [Polyangiaceae bacterium]